MHTYTQKYTQLFRFYNTWFTNTAMCFQSSQATARWFSTNLYVKQINTSTDLYFLWKIIIHYVVGINITKCSFNEILNKIKKTKIQPVWLADQLCVWQLHPAKSSFIFSPCFLSSPLRPFTLYPNSTTPDLWGNLFHPTPVRACVCVKAFSKEPVLALFISAPPAQTRAFIFMQRFTRSI